MSLIKSNIDKTIETIKNSSSIDLSSTKYMIIVLIAMLFFVIIMMMGYKYKITMSVEKKNTKTDGILLISEPVEPFPEVSICTKGMNISENGEHSYSIWIFVKDWAQAKPQEKIIFYRTYDDKTMIVSLDTITSTLKIRMVNSVPPIITNIGDVSWLTTSISDASELTTYIINDFYLQRWNHVVITQWGRNMDVFINGKLVRSFVMGSELKTKAKGTLKVGGHENQTVRGLLSRMKYYVRTLSVQEIYTLYTHGPSNNNDNIIPVNGLANVDVAI